MMTRNANFVAALLLVASVLVASGAAATGSIFGGLDLPSDGGTIGGSDFGWALGGYYTAPLSPVVDVGGLVAYNRFVSTLSDLPFIGDLFDYEFQPWEVQALGQFRFAGRLPGLPGLRWPRRGQLQPAGGGRRQQPPDGVRLAGRAGWPDREDRVPGRVSLGRSGRLVGDMVWDHGGRGLLARSHDRGAGRVLPACHNVPRKAHEDGTLSRTASRWIDRGDARRLRA